MKIELTREETFTNTRTRHSIEYDMEAGVDEEGHLLAKEMTTYSNQGAYASHGHAIAANGLTASRLQYACPNIRGEAYTVYTNCPTAGAMRGYGIPRLLLQKAWRTILAYKSVWIAEFRRKKSDPWLVMKMPIQSQSQRYQRCSAWKKEQSIHWDEKRKAYQNQTGDIRRGVGMALFSYKTGRRPISWRLSGKVALKSDGSVQLQVGATEIGQGADNISSRYSRHLHMDISRYIL